MCSVDGAAYLHASKRCGGAPSAAGATPAAVQLGDITPEAGRFTLEELLRPGARGAAFCERLHSFGYAVLSLDETAADEVSSLREASAAFFALPESAKCLVTAEAEGVGGEGVGYRDVPDKASQFLETYLDARGATYPPALASYPELSKLAAAVHRRLMGAARVLLALCATHLRLPPDAPLEALTACDRQTADAHEQSSSAARAGARPASGVGLGKAGGGAAVSSTLLRICHYQAAAAAEAPESGTAEPDVLFLPHTDSTLLTLSPLNPSSPGHGCSCTADAARG